MKRISFILSLVLLVVMVSGCTQPLPPGVKGALYTAQLSLDATLKDASDADSGIWNIPPNATLEEKLTLTEKQNIAFVKIMQQAKIILVK